MDKHLLIPLLQNLKEKNDELGHFDKKDLLRAQMDVISKTKLVEYEMEFFTELTGQKDMPTEMAARRDKVLSDWTEFAGNCGNLIAIVDGEEGEEAPMAQMKADGNFNAAYLQSNHEIGPDNIEALYYWAKFRFECGNYGEALNYLEAFRLLSTDPKGLQNAMWGKFSADMLMQSWEVAMEDVNRLKEMIDGRGESGGALNQLQQRTWLMHWGLFVFFNHPAGRAELIDLFLSERYMNTITTNCPHMLRYLCVAVITGKRRRNELKDLVKVIQSCKYMYSDPVTEFLECLYVDFDFEEAQKKLRECEQMLSMDFFLIGCQDDFGDAARRFIFETYCRIHQKIDIKKLAEQLNMRSDDAERWLVNLVREARLDAKIDSEANHVLMTPNKPDIYQQVIDKTKSLSFRSYVLAKQLEGRQQGQGGGGGGGNRGGNKGYQPAQ